MKVCLFNGMDKDNNIEDIIEKNLNKHQLNHLKLRNMKIDYCACCSSCSKLGRCVKNDDSTDVVEAYKENEILIYLTPIKYGGYSKELKKGIDKLLPIGTDKLLVKEGYMIHKIIYNNKKVVVIGILNDKDEEQEIAFSSLVKANYYNMDWKDYKQLILYKTLNSEEIEEKIKSVLKEVIIDV